MVKNRNTASIVSNTSNKKYNSKKQSFLEKVTLWFRDFLEKAE